MGARFSNAHDGRKHGAGCILGAHDVDELGKDAGLLAYKVLARTSDHARARKGLASLGLGQRGRGPGPPTKHRSGGT